MMKHTFSLRWTSGLQAALGATALAVLAACGGGGGGAPTPSARFESTTVGLAAGIRDNNTGIVWAAELAPAADSPGLLPEAHELLTLTDAGAAAISASFPFLVGKEVPLNETLRSEGNEPWVVSFTSDMRGGLRNDVPLAAAAHWRVLQRPTGSTAPSNFVYRDNGTVEQGATLMWRLCSEGSSHVTNTTTCSGSPTSLSLAEAKALPGNYGGYTGWRLPTKQELQTMLRLSNATGSLLAEPFKTAEETTLANAGVLEYWTSTPATSDPASEVWAVDFSLGIDPGGVALAPVTSPVLPPTALVRLVRSLK